MITSEILENIINQVSISTIIKYYIPVQKKGRNNWAVCPFHDDTNPSMSISDEKKMFKCFVCGEGGNIFSFVKEFENCSFIEAVKKTCEIAGLEMPEIKNISDNTPKIDHEISLIWEINEEANNYFKFMLNTEEGKLAFEYLTNREITQQQIDKFDIGFSSKNSKIIEFLESKGYSQTDLYKAGLISESEGRIYPNFKGRITFAIRDDNNNIIGFSARSFESEIKPKYINSPETKAFIKGNFLYNFFNAKKNIRLRKKIIIVEGFMDVIALDKCQIKNSVATMGTAFTKQHCNLIKGITKNVIIFMDRDPAGIKATLSILKLSEEENFNIEVCEGIEGLDADDIIKKYGSGKLNEILDKTVTKTQFLINILSAYYDLKTVEGRSNFIKKMIPEIHKISEDFRRDEYIKLIAEKINMSFNDIFHYFLKDDIIHKQSRKTDKMLNHGTNELWKTKIPNEEKMLLQSMLIHPEAVRLYKNHLNDFLYKDFKIIAAYLIAQERKIGYVDINLLLAELNENNIEDNIINLVKTLAINNRRTSFNEKSVIDCIKIIKNNQKNEKLKIINDKINKSTELEVINSLLEIKKKLRE